ncbi:MAG: C4-type zinc ribbon domain-containing protein [Thermodesulfobacteriota bacterium]|nr:C4-type zinc ribbon domain-containing protein [Candidatus Dadabacteria bacterium]
MELSELEVHLTEYPKKISAFEQELQSSKESLININNKREELLKVKSELENELNLNEENIKKSEERLFEIKTHKEYQALQKEITETKRMNLDLEEKLLDEMEKIEQLEAQIAEKNEELTNKETDYQVKISDYKEKLEEIKIVYEPKVEEKEKIVQTINPEILPLYEKIKTRNGEVLAVARNEICTGCNMNIPAQLFNEILTLSRIIQCPNCKKILYCEEESSSEAETG